MVLLTPLFWLLLSGVVSPAFRVRVEPGWLATPTTAVSVGKLAPGATLADVEQVWGVAIADPPRPDTVTRSMFACEALS